MVARGLLRRDEEGVDEVEDMVRGGRSKDISTGSGREMALSAIRSSGQWSRRV